MAQTERRVISHRKPAWMPPTHRRIIKRRRPVLQLKRVSSKHGTREKVIETDRRPVPRRSRHDREIQEELHELRVPIEDGDYDYGQGCYEPLTAAQTRHSTYPLFGEEELDDPYYIY